MPPDFPQTRAQHGIQFVLLEPLAPERARFRFTGPFEGHEVTWDTTLLTLAAAPAARRAFIDIGDETGNGRALTIALDIPAVDEPAILRTIVMIRQYKRLRAGRHEFGAPRIDPPQTGG